MTDVIFSPPLRSVPMPAVFLQPTPIKCTVNRDRFGRVIYVPGDGIGVHGTGPLARLSENAVVPHTDLYHFLVIGDYIEEEDDYEILESIGKGTAIGRLSWYADTNYTVFRMNDFDYAALGKRAVELASKFGRRHYDYLFYAKLFTWAAGYWSKEIFTGHIPPRPITTDRITYKSDHDFICIELYFAIWNQVGRRIRAHGCAPMPAEVINAVHRGTLAVIDHHNGKDGLVYKERPNSDITWSPLGQAAETMKKDDIVQVDVTRGYVTKYFQESNIGILAQVKIRNEEVKNGVPPSLSDPGGIDPADTRTQEEKDAEPKLVSTGINKVCANCGRSPCRGIDPAGTGCHLWIPEPEMENDARPVKVKPGPDLVALQKGQKRNRIHVYRQPFGYPIRLCDWVAVDPETIVSMPWIIDKERPEESIVNALDHYEKLKNNSVCRHCKGIASGKRTPPVGERLHGHGKGASHE